jgi:hypothetical protein
MDDRRGYHTWWLKELLMSVGKRFLGAINPRERKDEGTN